jgi:hypothetical protein
LNELAIEFINCMEDEMKAYDWGRLRASVLWIKLMLVNKEACIQEVQDRRKEMRAVK